jgi:hypothetical protein
VQAQAEVDADVAAARRTIYLALTMVIALGVACLAAKSPSLPAISA